MDKLFKGLTVGLGVLAIVFGTLYFATPNQTIVNNPPFGAVSGPDIDSPYVRLNGHYIFSYHSTLKQATTTVCSYKSPPATTTLTFGSVQFNTASSAVATAVEFGYHATSPSATTTRIGSVQNITAGFKATILASSTATALGFAVIPPNSFINIKALALDTVIPQTDSVGFVPVGTCDMTLDANF